MRCIAGPLIGLENAIRESVLLCQSEIRRYVRGVYILELGMARYFAITVLLATFYFDFVGPIHFPAVVHRKKRSMGVKCVVVGGQRHSFQRNSLPLRIEPAVRDVCVWQTMKEVVGSAVFLEDYNYMLNLCDRLSGQLKRAKSTLKEQK
jgi:hypothetical protein